MSTAAGALTMRQRPAAFVPWVVLLVAGVALWPSLSSLLAYWRDVHDYQHGYLIALLAAVWIGRAMWRFPVEELRASYAAASVLALVLVVWLVGVRGGIDILHQLLWPLALWAATWAAGGRALARETFAPLAFLYFSIPVWDYALPVLQRLSIFCTEHLLALLGVAATVSEYRVTIPEGTFAIVEGCSGKRYLMVTLAVAWLAIAVYRLPRRHILMFVAVSAVLALVMNWIRIVIVIYAGHVSEMRHYLVAVEHNTLGNVMFGLLLLAVVLLARRLAGAEPAAARTATEPKAAAPVGSGPHPATLPGLVVLGALLIAGFVALRPPEAVSTASSSTFSLPLATDLWQGPLPPASRWFPEYANADAQVRATYRSDSREIEIYANLYTIQHQGRELIHYGNSLAAPSGWTRPWSEGARVIKSSGLDLTSFQMQGPDGSRWVLAHVFLVGEHGFRAGISAKIAYGWLSIWGPVSAGTIALASRCDPGNCDGARAGISNFWENQQLRLRAMMPVGAHRFP